MTLASVPIRRVALAAAILLAAGCGSPEAARARGGGRGADPGNRGTVVEMHAGSLMYFETPCRTPKPECQGPRQVSGLPDEFPDQRRRHR